MISKPISYSGIVEALDFSQLTEIEQKELMGEIEEIVFKTSIMKLLEEMSENVREEFEALIDEDADESDFKSFLKLNVPNSQEVIADSIAELTDDILAVTQG